MKFSKTVTFFCLTFAVALAGLFGFGSYQPTPQQSELILALVSLAGIVLRSVTTEPLFPPAG